MLKQYDIKIKINVLFPVVTLINTNMLCCLLSLLDYSISSTVFMLKHYSSVHFETSSIDIL